MLLDLLRKRRSIRKFTGQAVEEEKIELLLEAALLSPSSKGNTPWHFVVVCDQDCISKLALAKPHGASFLKNAPLVIAVCGDSNQSDVWVEDCSIATLLLCVAYAKFPLLQRLRPVLTWISQGLGHVNGLITWALGPFRALLWLFQRLFQRQPAAGD